MKKVIFIDLNNSLCEKVEKLGIETICGDYIQVGLRQDRPVFMTASNPMWTFGGGLDYALAKVFGKLCTIKQDKGGGMERIANLVFAITVDGRLKATPEMVENAIQFAWDNTYDGETLLLMGCGTGIGGMSEDTLVDIIGKVVLVNN